MKVAVPIVVLVAGLVAAVVFVVVSVPEAPVVWALFAGYALGVGSLGVREIRYLERCRSLAERARLESGSG